MTFKEIIRRVRNQVREELGGFYYEGETDTPGQTDGTTFIDTTLSYVDDFLNQKEIVILEGLAIRNRRIIVDWDEGTGTGTVDPPFMDRVIASVSYQIGEKGFHSDYDIKDYIVDAQNDIISKLSYESLMSLSALIEKSSLTISSGEADFPASYLRPARPYCLVDGNLAVILPKDQYRSFLQNDFIQYKAYWRGNKLEYRPTSASTVTLEIIKKPTDPSDTNDPEIPEDLHHAIVDYCLIQAMLKEKNTGLVNKYEQRYLEKVANYNALFKPVTV